MTAFLERRGWFKLTAGWVHPGFTYPPHLSASQATAIEVFANGPELDCDKWEERFLLMAKQVSAWSKDPSTQVGAVVVRDRKVLGLGYNGFPRGIEDLPRLLADREEKYRRVVHAEINAILTAGYVEDAEMYLWPCLPCSQCTGAIIQAGISRIVAPETPAALEARWNFGLTRQLLAEAGVAFTEVRRNAIE